MAYAEITVIVNGAVQDEETFTDYTLEDAFIRTIEEEAAGHGYPVEVFELYHEHALTSEECECAQYVTDHHPRWSWNLESAGAK
jgi:hypothetical protein